MSCPARETGLLSGWLDGELDADEAAALAAHVARCPHCADEVQALEAVSEAVSAVVPDPDPARWSAFQRELTGELEREAALRRPLGWARRGLLAAAGLLLAVGPGLVFLRGRELPVHAAPRRLPSVELPVPDPAVTPGQPERPALLLPELERLGLSPAASQLLHRHGLVQLPTGATRLDQVIPGPGAPLPPLATADASLLVGGAVLQRAALTVELELVRPGLVRLLALLAREAEAARDGVTQPEVRADLSRLHARALVALLLEGEHHVGRSALSPQALARVLEEADLVRGGVGRRASRLDPSREVDDRAFAPRGAWADAELADHARAAAWISAWSPRLDPAHPGELREACLATLLLARGRLPEGRSGLHLQAELEAALELLSGPPDGLTPLDVAAVQAEVLGSWSPSPDALGDPAALAALGQALHARARARGVPRVRAVDQGEAAPRFQLLGGTRSLEGWALDRLGALPGRPRASALDLPALLGSRRARAALAAAGLEAPGLQAALEALRPAAQAFLRPGPLVPARTCLEQARDFSAAALLSRPQHAALPAQASPAWDDRALMAALGGLVGPRAAADVSPGRDRGPVPQIEPLPHLHARVAFAARRVAIALRELLPASARRERSLAQLERLALVEEALRDASLDLLEGRPLRPGSGRGLRLWAPTVRELGPGDVRVAEPVWEVGLPQGGLRVVHRAVMRVDRLIAVTLDPGTRQPVLAQGPAVLAGELVSDGQRLLEPDAISSHPAARAPAWATHVVNE